MSEQLFEGRHRALLVSRTHGDAFRFASHPPPDTCAVFGHDGKCRHSSLSGLPGWANEMACLQTMQPGAIQASLVKWAERWTTPSVIPRARQPDLPKRAEVPPATTWLVQPEQSLSRLAIVCQRG